MCLSACVTPLPCPQEFIKNSVNEARLEAPPCEHLKLIPRLFLILHLFTRLILPLSLRRIVAMAKALMVSLIIVCSRAYSYLWALL